MMRVFTLVFPVLLLLVSCSPAVKYSPSEIAGFSPSVQEHIKKGEVALGMSPLAVRYAWGAPDAVRIEGADSEGRFKEVWIYTKLRLYATKLVFTDGKLTGILSGLAKRKSLFKKEPHEEQEEKDAAAHEKGESGASEEESGQPRQGE